MGNTTEIERIKRGICRFTTICVGPDGREFDLGELSRRTGRGFPQRPDYIAVNAFVRKIEDEK